MGRLDSWVTLVHESPLREGDLGLFWQRANGAGVAERLTKGDQGASHAPESWSRNGKRARAFVSPERRRNKMRNQAGSAGRSITMRDPGDKRISIRVLSRGGRMRCIEHGQIGNVGQMTILVRASNFRKIHKWEV